MYWNHRIVDLSAENGGEPWFEVRVVMYDADDKVVGTHAPCLGTEDATRSVELLQRMIDDIQRNPEPVKV
jgi:hypothetical protein